MIGRDDKMALMVVALMLATLASQCAVHRMSAAGEIQPGDERKDTQ